jgi:dolichol kinase
VRDVLHVGAGVWVLGWPGWHGAAIPIAIAAAAFGATLVVPLVAPRIRIAAHLVHSVTGGDERWAGLVHYALAFAVFTVFGLLVDPFPAAAGLLALSLGDGLGGATGRAFGRHYFHAPQGKRKSFEGSFVVGFAACVGIVIAAAVFHRDVDGQLVVALGGVAAFAEALSPRGTDNLLVPAFVWAAATLAT